MSETINKLPGGTALALEALDNFGFSEYLKIAEGDEDLAYEYQGAVVEVRQWLREIESTQFSHSLNTAT